MHICILIDTLLCHSVGSRLICRVRGRAYVEDWLSNVACDRASLFALSHVLMDKGGRDGYLTETSLVSSFTVRHPSIQNWDPVGNYIFHLVYS